MKRALRGIPAATLALALAAGCGGGGATSFPGGEHPAAGGGGVLTYALAPLRGDIDPLKARTPAAKTLSAQLFEPLVSSLHGPYGRGRERLGLALGTGHSADRRVWSVSLRPGVRFQDGTSMSGSAVLSNAERWRTSSEGRRLLPGLLATSTPRPDLVRFIFHNPVADLPSLLADPRLGLASPRALRPLGGARAALKRWADAGSGPFELTSRPDSGLVLSRNRDWWGSRHGLGPALDRIAFTFAASESRRLELLRAGDVRVVGGLSTVDARRLRRDPLLTAFGTAGGNVVGYERSVRGLDSARPQPLNGVWLAIVGQP